MEPLPALLELPPLFGAWLAPPRPSRCTEDDDDEDVDDVEEAGIMVPPAAAADRIDSPGLSKFDF